MSKKQPDIQSITNELRGASAFFQQPPRPMQPHQAPPQAVGSETPEVTRKSASMPTRISTQPRSNSRELIRDKSRRKLRDLPNPIALSTARDLPTRDAIQEFSFRLRDEYKVKVQAEVPPQWQDELEIIARELDVKKLELYRFILGEFLGKVKRNRDNSS